MRGYGVIPGILLLGALVATCDSVASVEAGARDSTPAAVLIAAGDIAACDSEGDEATAALLDQIAGTIATLGDHVYPSGTAEEFADCYAPSWGRHKDRTRPAPGNHDYKTPDAAGYFGYFGEAAGDPARGYYSYELGEWHIIVLNTNCAEVGGCEPNSPQEQWLRDDLAAHPAACTLVYGHHPRFSSGIGHDEELVYGEPRMVAWDAGGTVRLVHLDETGPFWVALYAAGADVILAGHEHNYERFALQDPQGNRDPARGIRQFVVGTGGANSHGFGQVDPNSEVRSDNVFGVLTLTLRPGGYDWAFVPAAGSDFRDVGSDQCH
jgi:acid phosphatase type 7